MFQIRSLLGWLFLWKSRRAFSSKRDSKVSYGFGGNGNLSKLSGLCLFCTLNRMKTPFSDVFLELLFFMCFLIFTKICLVSSPQKYPPTWSFKLAESNEFKVDVKYKIGLSWIGDTWLTDSSKESIRGHFESFSNVESNCQI